MAVSIVPTVLARSEGKYRSLVQKAEKIGSRIHLDIMDGKFVRTKSIGPSALARLSLHKPATIHFMVQYPDRWLTAVKACGASDVILPVENAHLKQSLSLFQRHRRRVWLSINPGTPISRLRPWIGMIYGVHVLTVKSGYYHAPFVPSAVKTIARLHRRYPQLRLSCDGGVTPHTAPRLVRAGTTVLGVGSSVMQAENAKTAMAAIKRSIKGL